MIRSILFALALLPTSPRLDLPKVENAIEISVRTTELSHGVKLKAVTVACPGVSDVWITGSTFDCLATVFEPGTFVVQAQIRVLEKSPANGGEVSWGTIGKQSAKHLRLRKGKENNGPH